MVAPLSFEYRAQQHFGAVVEFLKVGEAFAVLEAPATAAKAIIVASNADRSRLMGNLSIISYKM